MSSTTAGIDPLRLKVGDVVEDAWDDLTAKERAAGLEETSCHCSFLVRVGPFTDPPFKGPTVRVIAHDLKAGDIIRGLHYRGDADGCHCDLYIDVERNG